MNEKFKGNCIKINVDKKYLPGYYRLEELYPDIYPKDNTYITTFNLEVKNEKR